MFPLLPFSSSPLKCLVLTSLILMSFFFVAYVYVLFLLALHLIILSMLFKHFLIFPLCSSCAPIYPSHPYSLFFPPLSYCFSTSPPPTPLLSPLFLHFFSSKLSFCSQLVGYNSWRLMKLSKTWLRPTPIL